MVRLVVSDKSTNNNCSSTPSFNHKDLEGTAVARIGTNHVKIVVSSPEAFAAA